MREKTSVFVLCFAYRGAPLPSLAAAPHDLAKVLSYACWLKARTYMVLDFDPAPRRGIPEAQDLPRLLRQASVAQKVILSAEPAGGAGPEESKDGRALGGRVAGVSYRERVLSAAASVRGDNLLIYYSGHADDRAFCLPDASRLAVLDLHSTLSWGAFKNICWIFDACRLSGRSLRLPFLCSPAGPRLLRGYGAHCVPTIALSASLEKSRIAEEGGEEGEERSGSRLSPGRGRSQTEPAGDGGHSFSTEAGSLFTSALLPLLMSDGRHEWSGLLGVMSQLTGYRDQEAVCLKLSAYISDCGLTAIPYWLKKQSIEKVGPCWLVRR